MVKPVATINFDWAKSESNDGIVAALTMYEEILVGGIIPGFRDRNAVVSGRAMEIYLVKKDSGVGRVIY